MLSEHLGFAPISSPSKLKQLEGVK